MHLKAKLSIPMSLLQIFRKLKAVWVKQRSKTILQQKVEYLDIKVDGILEIPMKKRTSSSFLNNHNNIKIGRRYELSLFSMNIMRMNNRHSFNELFICLK